MPSHRKRIGFLPSEEVHRIIDKLSKDNKFSQSKVTGLLVEEALRSRGVLKDNLYMKDHVKIGFSQDLYEKESSSENIKSHDDSNIYKVNKKTLSDNIKMINEFIEFKYFKKIMNDNKNIFD